MKFLSIANDGISPLRMHFLLNASTKLNIVKESNCIWPKLIFACSMIMSVKRTNTRNDWPFSVIFVIAKYGMESSWFGDINQ